MKSQQRIRWDETPFGKGRSESETPFWRRAESQARKESCSETVEGEEEWGEEDEESGCEWDFQEAVAGHEVGFHTAVEPCQRGSCLACAAGAGWAGAARSVRGCGCVAVGEPGQARARQGRRGRAAAATSRRMIILWSPQKSKVMCVC